MRRHLPAHLARTRAEPGCLNFEVRPTEDPLVWTVDEAFTDPAAFAAHQSRTAGSPWALGTATVRRDYEVTEATAPGG